MSTTHNGGLATAREHGESPFDIYRNALNFVMSSLSLDEDAATEVILHELGDYANDWQKIEIQSAAKKVKAAHLTLQSIDWKRAWLN